MTSPDSSRHAAGSGQLGPVYEQPLNERMRTFLRLDFLYQQTLYHEEREDPWSTRAAMSALLEILAITARGDIRSEVLKDLERQMAVMHDYTTRQGVDTSRLKAVLGNLTRLRTELNSVGALFMQRLRDSEFLNSIKHRVVPWHSYKFTATLQQAQSCANPVMLRVETRAGHGAGKPVWMQIEDYADQWAFLVKSLHMEQTVSALSQRGTAG